MPSWDPDQYADFAAPRFRPGLDLLAQVRTQAVREVLDLGCGRGELTLALAERFPAANVTGVDSSESMLVKARELESRVTWVQGDASSWEPKAPLDLIYSNACFHWLQDHEHLLHRLMDQLNPGGTLAFQLPLSHHEPSHVLMRQVLEDEELGSPELIEELRRPWVLESEEYVEILAPMGEVEVWETRYFHRLEGDNAILEWVSGTGLRPVLDGLSESEREAFLAAYAPALDIAYPRSEDGSTLYPFPRLFCVAKRS